MLSTAPSATVLTTGPTFHGLLLQSARQIRPETLQGLLQGPKTFLETWNPSETKVSSRPLGETSLEPPLGLGKTVPSEETQDHPRPGVGTPGKRVHLGHGKKQGLTLLCHRVRHPRL